MNSLVMWIGGVLAVILAALFAVPLFVDWNGYRGVFEEEASRILGRDVRVAGNVNLRLLPSPYLRFEKMRIADTRENASEPLFRAESFTLWLAVPPLLKGDVDVRRIDLDRPVVNLTVDGDGVGNWSTLGVTRGRLPFAPQHVALQSVAISGGQVTLTHLQAGELLRLDNVRGDLAADALAGPFKFSGEAVWKGLPRELRLATSTMDATSELRFKATARTKVAAGEPAGASAQIEGSIVELADKARLDGHIAMLLPLPELPAASSVAPPGTSQPSTAAGTGTESTVLKPAGPVALDIKGKLGVDARQVTVSEIVASIENVGQPQLATGALKLVLGRPQVLELEASASWLDFDRLAPSSGRASPAETLAAMARGLSSTLPERTSVKGRVAIEQITLGGEAVSGLDIALARDEDGPLQIERFFAELPAGGRMAMEGRLGAASSGVDLNGRLTLAGPSFERFAKWASGGSAAGRIAPDGVFTLDTGVAIAAGTLRLTNSRATLAGHTLTGALTLPITGRTPLSVNVEADTIDSAWLWQGGIDRGALMAWLDRLSQRGGEGGSDPGVGRDLDLKLRAHHLRGPDRVLDGVVADVAVRDGVLRFDRLAFRSGDALEVDVSGDVAAAAPPGASGVRRARLAGHVSAGHAGAVSTLLELLQITAGDRTRRIAAMAPLALAGSLEWGQRRADALDIRLDGRADDGRIAVRALLDGGLVDWLAAPAEITLSAENARADELLALLGGSTHAATATTRGASAVRTNAALKVVGSPRKGLVTDVVVTGPGVQLAYNGRSIVAADSGLQLDGMLDVAADRLGDVLAITGLSEAGNGLDQAITGTLGLSSESDGTLKLTPSGLTIAGARIDGSLNVARGEGGRPRLAGEVSVDRATVAGMVAGLVAGAPRPMPALSRAITENSFGASSGLWSDQPFATQSFQRLDGNIMVRVARLVFAPGLTLADARLGLAFAPGRITATLSEAKALGGRIEGELTFDKAAAGVRASGRLAADGIALAEVARAAATGPARGVANARLSFNGRALSPRALVSSFEGAGRLSLSGAEVAGMSPQAVQEVVRAVFAKQIAVNEAALAGAITAGLANGHLDVGARELGLELGDGALKLERLAVAAPSGRVETLVTVDLATLDAESEWRLTAHNEEPGRPEWPRISVFYTGPLGRLATIEPRLVLGSFERELTVRRMEHEVEQLERLRRLDEERARAERERQRAAEAERQRLIEAERQRRAEQRQLQQPQQQPQHRQADPAAVAPGTTPPAAVDSKWKSGTVTISPSLLPSAATTATGAGAASEATAASAPPTTVSPAGAPEEAAVAPRPRRARPPKSPAAADTQYEQFAPSNLY